MKKYSVWKDGHEIATCQNMGVASHLARATSGDAVTWVGFVGLPALACVFRRQGDIDVLETACLYKAEATRVCREMGGEEDGFFVRSVVLNAGYPTGGEA